MERKQAACWLRRVCLFVIVSAAASSSFADVLLTSSGGGTVRHGSDFTLGTGFTVGSPGIVVSALGIYDVGGQFASAHQIAFWDPTARDTPVPPPTLLPFT